MIEFELKKCEYISKLKDDEIKWSTDMPFDNLTGLGFFAETEEAYLEREYYKFFSKS